MGLRAQAELDLATTLESLSDFGQLMTVTSPSEGAALIEGQTGDIGALIDPDTGQGVSGRLVHVSIRLSSLVAAGFASVPEGVPEDNLDPWLVAFGGVEFVVRESRPDRTLGIVTLILEFWQAAP